MSGRIDALDTNAYIKYVRIGNRYALGPLGHPDQSCKILGIDEDDTVKLRKTLLSTGLEIDMGLMRRNPGNKKVRMGGESSTLNFPLMDAKYEEIKQRTIDLILPDFPDEVFEIGSR